MSSFGAASKGLLAAAVAVWAAACAVEPISPPREKPPTEEEPLGSSFIPDPETDRLRRSRALSRDLEKLLVELDGVLSARVQLSLARSPLFGAATHQAPSRAAVVVHLEPEARVSHADIKSLLSAGVMGLEGEHISIVEQRATAQSLEAPRIVDIGPLRVTAETALFTKLLLGGLLAICAFLAAALVYTSWRLRSSRRRR